MTPVETMILVKGVLSIVESLVKGLSEVLEGKKKNPSEFIQNTQKDFQVLISSIRATNDRIDEELKHMKNGGDSE